MSGFFLGLFYILAVLISLVACYSLLNAGNPRSLLRIFFPDPGNDVYVAMVSSVLVFILGFFIFFIRDREGFRQLIEANGDRIRDLRKKGESEENIADEILAAMGSHRGYKHNLARKKLMICLSEFK
ncbi:hypothetical protein QUF80_01710 [Desulfococcaceae bacterium HSG8]|nr:hypothetical protein [Desulfococcaceae bacterium HSG8]